LLTCYIRSSLRFFYSGRRASRKSCRQARLVEELVEKVGLGWEMDRGMEGRVCMDVRSLFYCIF
jgi:hypothetical protein